VPVYPCSLAWRVTHQWLQVCISVTVQYFALFVLRVLPCRWTSSLQRTWMSQQGAYSGPGSCEKRLLRQA